MSYIIVNPRCGTPGTEYIERPGVNTAILLANGFIKQSDKKTQKPATIKSKKPKE
jgi:hypothetical protein